LPSQNADCGQIIATNRKDPAHRPGLSLNHPDLAMMMVTMMVMVDSGLCRNHRTSQNNERNRSKYKST
jgi:hypothetical protein